MRSLDVRPFRPEPVQATIFSTSELHLPISVPLSQSWFVAVTEFPVLHLTLDMLGPVYMEKRCSSKESHLPSPVNFIKRLYENKADPLAKAKSVRACYN